MSRKNSSSSNAFWKIVEDSKREVEKWPEWKRAIKITSASASTGDFIAPSKASDPKQTLKP